MEPPVHFGLIGAGGIGAYHLSAIEALESQGGTRLVAVTEPAVEHFAEMKVALENRGVHWYLDYQDMLRKETGLDAVTIATPIPFHFKMTLACIERGLFVNLEKPPVPLIQQLDSLIEADSQVRVHVGFQMVGSDGMQHLKAAIIKGKLGELQSIRASACWPRLDGYYNRASWAGRMALDGEPVFDGPATNALAHLIHNIMFLAGKEMDGFNVPVEVQGELYRSRPIDSYDVACLRGYFQSGLEFFAAFAHATETELPFQIEVRGTEGWARITKDGARFESSFGDMDCFENTQTLIDKTYLQFVDFTRGAGNRGGTRLGDSRGFVLTTNGMLIASNGIHNIGGQFSRVYRRGGDRGYDVSGLFEAIESSLTSGRLFSELGFPWAVRTSPVSLNNLTFIDFSDYQKT